MLLFSLKTVLEDVVRFCRKHESILSANNVQIFEWIVNFTSSSLLESDDNTRIPMLSQISLNTTHVLLSTISILHIFFKQTKLNDIQYQLNNFICSFPLRISILVNTIIIIQPSNHIVIILVLLLLVRRIIYKISPLLLEQRKQILELPWNSDRETLSTHLAEMLSHCSHVVGVSNQRNPKKSTFMLRIWYENQIAYFIYQMQLK